MADFKIDGNPPRTGRGLRIFPGRTQYPLLSQFENKLLPTFKNAMLLSTAYLPRSIAIGILNLLPLALLVLNTYLFLQISVLWLFLYYAASAYLIARMLKPVFTPLMTGTEPQEGEAV